MSLKEGIIMNLPKRITYIWIDKIRQKSFASILVTLLLIYIAVNILFAALYDHVGSLNDSSFLDYLYFSFITSLTIGFPG